MVNKLLERERELAAVDATLQRRSGLVIVEGRAGIGKTSLLDAACQRAMGSGYEILRARGSELEAGFAFGVVRQVFERRLLTANADEREALLDGSAAAARPLFFGHFPGDSSEDTSFAVLHGLYWLAANLAASRPVLLVIDDAHWADESSLRWLAYLAPRMEGLSLAMLVALRPAEATTMAESLLALRGQAGTIVQPALLSEGAVTSFVRDIVGGTATDELCATIYKASGGNPFYLTELLRGFELKEQSTVACEPGDPLITGRAEITTRVIARTRRLGVRALDLSQALAVLGDDCELRLAAAIAGVEMQDATRLAADLARHDVLATDNPPRFLHPVLREAIEASLGSDKRDAAHRSAARLLEADGAPAGQIAAHLLNLRPAGDCWVVARLREAAQIAVRSGAPQAAVVLLDRARAEPPPFEQRVTVLRELARAEASAGRETACLHLEEALRLVVDPRERARIALEVAHAYATLFRWADAVDVIERAREELGDIDEALMTRLEGELVVCALHDARRASRAVPVLERLRSRPFVGSPAAALAVAQGMAMTLAGRPAEDAAHHLEQALARAGSGLESWDTRAALLWSLIVAERFEAVEAALEPMIAEGHRVGSARGLVATYSALGLLKLRLGALPEADSAARVALRVLQEGDFRPGLAFAATVLADIALEAGDLDEAQALLELLPQEGWPAGVGTVLIPSTRGRLRLAQGRPAEALTDFRTCAEMFSSKTWGMEMRDVGYVHARVGAIHALLRLGERGNARELAEGELADARMFGTPRALGIALRVAGLAHGEKHGIELLQESVAALRNSPAMLERAHSLVELGSALRRDGQRTAAREPLAEALDLAARCGARPLAARAREELKVTGARPRRQWRTGLEALTPSELRVVRLAAEDLSNRDIAHRLYVTLKTIEGHLSRAYTKLGISSRDELASTLAHGGTKTGVRNRKH